MATNYTSLLGFALPTTGELAGTWGQVVNDSITQLVEDSVAGTASVSVTSGDVTLTTTGSGAANQARCAIIIATGTPGTARNIIAPSQSKAYIVINQSDSNITFKGAATTGHTIAPGYANLLAWNGSDFQDIEQGDVRGPASATDNAVVRFDGTTGQLVQNSAVTIADTTGDIQTSGNIIVGDGTASLPSITNVGDTNTGLYFSADNEVSISTDGTQRVVVDATGDLGVGNSSPSFAVDILRSAGDAQLRLMSQATGTNGIIFRNNAAPTSAKGAILYPNGSAGSGADTMQFVVDAVERMRITTAGFTQPVAYADTVVAIGNTGTAQNINLQAGNVFTATLTGNCTFTLQNPIATGSSSFTLILTNDATPGRTVAFAGGTFRYPDGSVTRTTTANATDIWFFFTPNGGTTWYGSIPMKNLS